MFVEGRRLQQDGHGLRTNLAVGAADDAAEADGIVSVGDDQMLGCELTLDVIQSNQCLAGFGPAYDDGVIFETVIVKGVQRLVVFQHDVVSNVDHVADGAEPRLGEPVLQPLGGRTNLDAGDEAGGISLA